MTLRAIDILGVSSATRKFHNDNGLGATIALCILYVIFVGWLRYDESCILGEIRNLFTFLEFPRVQVERQFNPRDQNGVQN